MSIQECLLTKKCFLIWKIFLIILRDNALFNKCLLLSIFYFKKFHILRMVNLKNVLLLNTIFFNLKKFPGFFL